MNKIAILIPCSNESKMLKKRMTNECSTFWNCMDTRHWRNKINKMALQVSAITRFHLKGKDQTPCSCLKIELDDLKGNEVYPLRTEKKIPLGLKDEVLRQKYFLLFQSSISRKSFLESLRF